MSAMKRFDINACSPSYAQAAVFPTYNAHHAFKNIRISASGTTDQLRQQGLAGRFRLCTIIFSQRKWLQHAPRTAQRWAYLRRASLAWEGRDGQQGDGDYDGEDDEDYDEEDERPFMTEEEILAAQQASMVEYAALKEQLLRRTQRFSAALAGYLLLVASGEIAACSLVGGVVGYAYFVWLMRDVDRVQPGDYIAIMEADQLPDGPVRTAARVAASYSHSLRPRLLALLGLAGAVYLYNLNAEELLGARPLTLIEQGAVLGGFLSYKVSLLLQVYEELKPKFDPEELLRSKRPMMVEVEDVSMDLRKLLAQKPSEQEGKARQQQQPGAQDKV